MPTVTGRVFISVNGQRIRSREGATLETGGINRTAATSDAGVDGFTEAVAVPQVDCEVNHTANTSLDALHSVVDGVLTFETDTGRIYTLNGATSTTPPKLSKGVVTLQYQGKECIEG
ncbi:phage tail tube protein [Variovorax gossypii]